MPLTSKDLISLHDLTSEEMEEILELAGILKGNPGHYADALAGQTLAMIFEKPSLRTRVTFEVAMTQLGGAAVYLATNEIGMGTRESVPDVARNLSRWVDVVTARVFAHRTLDQLVEHGSVPVINGLSDLEHPCQAVADFFTLWERGLDLATLRLAWVGDGNNVCHSILLLASLCGTASVVATPPGFAPREDVLEACRALGGRVTLTSDPREAIEGADVIYTDTWISMGQEGDREQRLEAFQRYQLNETLLGFAPSRALVMHCLPAHRGEEITDAVLDGPRSVIFDQAENRLHAQKGIIIHLLDGA